MTSANLTRSSPYLIAIALVVSIASAVLVGFELVSSRGSWEKVAQMSLLIPLGPILIVWLRREREGRKVDARIKILGMGLIWESMVWQSILFFRS